MNIEIKNYLNKFITIIELAVSFKQKITIPASYCTPGKKPVDL
jgi:hypothetical protein